MHLKWDNKINLYQLHRYGFKFNTHGYALIKPQLRKDLVYCCVNRELIKFWKEFECEANSKPKRPIHIIVRKFMHRVLDYDLSRDELTAVVMLETWDIALVCMDTCKQKSIIKIERDLFSPFLMTPPLFDSINYPFMVFQ